MANHKKATLAILVSDTIDFKTKNSYQRQEGHFIIIKGSTPQGRITVTNICVSNNKIKYRKQKLTEMKGKTDNSTTIASIPHLQ